MKQHTFELSIDDKMHTITVEASPWKTDIKKIYVDGKLVVNHKRSDLWKSYMFYKLLIDSHPVVVEIKTDDIFKYEYDIYINDKSITTGRELNQRKTDAELQVSKGFLCFLRSNLKETAQKMLLFTIVLLGVNLIQAQPTKLKYILISIICFITFYPIGMLLFLAYDWFAYTSTIKKWDKQYQN